MCQTDHTRETLNLRNRTITKQLPKLPRPPSYNGATLAAGEGEDNGEDNTGRAQPSRAFLYSLRLVWICIFIAGWYFNDALQHGVNILWGYLLNTWIFKSVYFETWWTTVVYPPIIAIPFLIDKIKSLDKYKIDKSMKWQHAGIRKILVEAVFYVTPLMALDTVMVKHYAGVDPGEWKIRRANLIQYDRALPVDPPTVAQIVFQLVMSFIIYDILFFSVHFILHKNHWLYKHVHAEHHDHDVIFGRVTNQLSVPERTVLVLSANEALKLVGGHPLTRTLFVPFFLWWIVENHYGYDLPCTLDKVIPFGLVGGAVKHHAHHTYGSRNYQPFFTYCDNLLSSRRQKMTGKYQ